MSKIDDLVKQLCPDGVEKVTLEKCTTIERGKRVTKGDVHETGLYPVISGGVSPMGFLDVFNRYPNTITVSQYGTAGYVDFQTTKFWANDICYSIFPNKNVCNRYLWYYLKHKQNYIYRIRNTDATPFSLPLDTLKRVEIPLPPLPIQEEIVRILDKFTSLIDKIDEEITLRQKQYEYYRENLLAFKDGGCEWKKISTIGKLVRGNGLQKKDFTECGIGCIHYGQIYTKLGFSINKPLTYVSPELSKKLTKVEPNNLVIACTSENVEDVCKSVVWLGKEAIVTGGHACVFKHNENPKYIGYCFLTNSFQTQKRKYAYGAKVVDIKTEKIGEIELPVPPLSRQQQIVTILDKFESVIEKLKEARDLRQKQYEYYREKLLTF